MLFLQRDTDANRIYMEVLNVRSTYADGPDEPCMMYPSAESQISLMKQVLNESKLLPNDISFLEASGVAIKTADADELEAINQVYRDRKEPLPIGAVKSNLGNAVAVNTINSIIKVNIKVISIKRPLSLHYKYWICVYSKQKAQWCAIVFLSTRFYFYTRHRYRYICTMPI